MGQARAPLTYIQPQADIPDRFLDAHSLYLELLAETGVVGLLLLVAFAGVLTVRIVTLASRRTRSLTGCASG